jgi:hypothetical protein
MNSAKWGIGACIILHVPKVLASVPVEGSICKHVYRGETSNFCHGVVETFAVVGCYAA